MSTKFEIASDAAATTWEDITGLVNWQNAKFGGSAHRGEIFTANGFDLLDDAGIRSLPNYRVVRITETATTPDAALFRGRVIGNGKARGVIITEPSKVFDVQLVDHNKDFGGQAFVGTSRPAEDDDDRVRFLLETYLQGQNRASTDLTDTYLQSTTPVALPAHRYEAVAAIDWFNHIIESTGKQFFITVDSELFYGPVTSTVYAADLAITDVLPLAADEYFPIDPSSSEVGGEMYTGVRRRISGGRIVTTVRDAVELANDRWRTGIVDEEVRSVLAATTRNNKFLDEFDHTQETFSCAIDLDETEVDKIKYGQTVSVRSAAMGLLSPTTLRIGSLQWTKISADRYRANLELGYPTKFGRRSGGTGSTTPTPGPTPFIPDNDSEPSDEIASLYEGITETGGAPGTVISDTFSLLGGHPWRVTVNLASNTGGRVTVECATGTHGMNEGMPSLLTDSWDWPAGVGDSTGCVVKLTSDSAGQTMVTHATDAGSVEYTDGSGLGTPTLVPTVPYFGQQVIESLTGDGTTDDFQTNHPYQENSLLVYVGGIQVIPTQVDPETGDFSLPFATASGTEVVMVYVAASGVDTGAGNDSTPPSVTPVIPVTLDWGEDADITTLDYDDVADAGILNEVARADHRHGMPSEGGGGGGGATIQYGSLKPASPDFDFATTDMTGWSAHSVSGSFVVGQAFPQAIDGSHLLIPYKTSQRGLLYRTVGNTDFDIIVGGLRMKAPGAGDHMPGIAILNSSGTGVGIVQYNDNNVYLANITTWAYASFVQQISKYGHNVNAANLAPGDEVPYFLRLQRATNSWTASISITGSAWDDVTASSSVTITADRFAIGNFLNDRPGHFICDFIDGI